MSETSGSASCLHLLRERVLRDPEELHLLAELCVVLEHLPTIPEGFEPARFLPPLLRLMREQPDFRAPRAVYRGLQGLEAFGPTTPQLPLGWRERHEARSDEDGAYCARTGLPVLVRRRADGGRMVLVPEGRMILGRPAGDVDCAYNYHRDSTPRVEVWLSSFYIDLEPLRVGEWVDVARARGSAVPEPEAREGFVKVRWEQAREYARWVGGRLPSQAEHEKAMRGEEGWRAPWGDELPTKAEVESEVFRARVESPFGLTPAVADRLDWCEDRTHPWEYPEFAAVNPLSMDPESRERNSLEDEIMDLETRSAMVTRILDYDVGPEETNRAFARDRVITEEIQAVRARIEAGEGTVTRYRALRGAHPRRPLHSHWENLSPSGHSLCSRGRVTDRYFDVESARHGFRVVVAADRPGRSRPESSGETARVLDEQTPRLG